CREHQRSPARSNGGRSRARVRFLGGKAASFHRRRRPKVASRCSRQVRHRQLRGTACLQAARIFREALLAHPQTPESKGRGRATFRIRETTLERPRSSTGRSPELSAICLHHFPYDPSKSEKSLNHLPENNIVMGKPSLEKRL